MLIIFDKNSSDQLSILPLICDTNFFIFWVRELSPSFFSVKTFTNYLPLDQTPKPFIQKNLAACKSVKIKGIYDAKILGRLLRFWVCKMSKVAEKWKEVYTESCWEDNRVTLEVRNTFLRGLGKSLEVKGFEDWRNIIKRNHLLKAIVRELKNPNKIG